MNRLGKISLLLLGAVCGCTKTRADRTARVSLAPTVKVAVPQVRDIQKTIGQPGEILPYEQTAIYSKIAGFVQKWYVDIGSKVKKDQLLVQLEVPELEKDYEQELAAVEQQKAMVNQANTLVDVAKSNLQAATDAVTEAEAGLNSYVAEVNQWQEQVNRLTSMVRDRTINPQDLLQTKSKLEATQANLAAAQAAVSTKKSQEHAAKAQIEKANADLAAAVAEVKVAEARAAGSKAMFNYTKIMAPYDGVITSRNVNTGDFVRPASGDATGSNDGSASNGRSIPLFVVARTDPVMFVIGVPEVDAPYVSVGTKATLRVQALAGREFEVPVTRTALALHNQSRTLQVEIDLPNPQDELLPGMYAYGSVEIDRHNVRAIPVSATVEIGNRMCCYMVKGDKAVRTQIQSGVSDGTYVEVVRRRSYPTTGQPGNWEDFSGSEQVISGDLTEVADGKQVNVEAAKVAQAAE